jgi:hypothetical protein
MRQTTFLAALIVLSFVTLGLLWRPAPAQQKTEPAAVERFRVRRVNDNWFVLLDTATGHCWSGRNTPTFQWQDIGNPAKKK